ncbi:MAG: acyltransferase [Firmicutes bacterium]|nr:acyltransferase [Candidatus Colivicinus equi]
MTNKRKACSFISFFLSVLLFFSAFTFRIHADDYIDNGDSYTLNSGITIILPKEYKDYAVWNGMSEDSPGWKKMSFSSFDDAIKIVSESQYELNTYRNDLSGSSGYIVSIGQYDAPEDLSNENILTYYFDKASKKYNTDDFPALGYGVSDINGTTFYKIYYETGGNDFENSYSYLLITKSGKVHEITFTNHSISTDIYHLDYLTHGAMSTISISAELIKDAVTLKGDYFRLIRGYHQSKFDFESLGEEVHDYNVPTNTSKTPFHKFLSFEFPTWIIGIALIAVLLFGVKISKKNEWQENPLSLEKSREIQGFAALAIIIHHLAQETALNAGVLNIFSEFGVLFVGIFFFFSGYGLYTSLKTKENYLKGFPKKRLSAVLVPLYVCILIYVLSACIKGQSFSLKDLLVTLSGWILINTHMWYIIEITVLYIAFFIIYSLIKNRKIATITMTVFVIALSIFSLLLGHGADMSSKYWFMGEWWYNTTLAFVLGIIVSQNIDKLRTFVHKYYKILLPLFISLTVIFYFLTNYAINTYSYWNEAPRHPGYLEKFICLSAQLPWVLFFVITLILIMLKVNFSNKILKFLGSISLELYLVHNLFLVGLRDGSIMSVKSNSLYIVLTILLSIGFATIVKGLDKYILSFINKPKEITTNDNKRIHSIDALRIVMAFFVVTIHIPFNDTVSNVFITYGKAAVPFFLVVCGYFLYRKDSKEMMNRLKKQAIRMFAFYVGSNILYFIAYAIKASIEGESVFFTSKQITDFILYNMSPFSEHLWFFGSLLYALVIMMMLNKFKVINYAMFISPLLIATYVLLSHLNVVEAYVLRNAILVSLPYTMMGMMIKRYEDKLLKVKTSIYWIAALILCITAIVELNTYKQGVGVPFISIEFLVYIIVILCLKYPNFGKDTLAETMGRELSLPIYILHVLVIMFIGYIIPSNTGLISNYGAITVFVITALISSLYVKIKKMILKLKNH